MIKYSEQAANSRGTRETRQQQREVLVLPGPGHGPGPGLGPSLVLGLDPCSSSGPLPGLGLAEVLASGLLSSEPGVSCAPGVPDSGLNQQGAASETSQPNIDTIREYLLDHRQTVISRVDLA